MAVLSSKKTLSAALWAVVTARCFCTFGYLCFGNLGEWHIEDYDEARHGINAYEMIQNNDYLVHTFRGEPDLWNTKPPLSFWLIRSRTGCSGTMPSRCAFSPRFPWCSRPLHRGLGDAELRQVGHAADTSRCSAANSILYGQHFTRFGDADSQYQFFFTLSMLCLLLEP